jgi:hypothetical protein
LCLYIPFLEKIYLMKWSHAFFWAKIVIKQPCCFKAVMCIMLIKLYILIILRHFYYLTFPSVCRAKKCIVIFVAIRSQQVGKVSLLSISFQRSTRQVTTDNSHRLFKNVLNLLNVLLLVHWKLKCSNKFTDLGEINWVTSNNDKYYRELCSEIMKWKVTKSNFTTSNVC